MVDNSTLETLRAKLENGTVHAVFGNWGVTFANNMLREVTRGKTIFSVKQLKWIHKLAEADTSQAFKPVAAQNIDVRGIVDIFEHAAKTLRYPKIRLQTTDGEPVVLSRAGSRSRNPGSINVTDGGPFGDNRWYGRIDPSNGEWQFPRNGAAPESVQNVVFELSEDPVSVAASHGKITGSCCFCAKTLTDSRSLAEGYGPVCAERWGLPWGNRSGEITNAAQNVGPPF